MSANLGSLRLYPSSLERCPWAPQKEPKHSTPSDPTPGSDAEPAQRPSLRHMPSEVRLRGLGALLSGGYICSPSLTGAWPPEEPLTRPPERPRHPLRHPCHPGSGRPSGRARALGKAGLSEDKGRSPPGGARHPHHTGHLAPWTACQGCLHCPVSWLWKDVPPAPWVTEGARHLPTTASPPRGILQRHSFSIKTHTRKEKGETQCHFPPHPPEPRALQLCGPRGLLQTPRTTGEGDHGPSDSPPSRELGVAATDLW